MSKRHIELSSVIKQVHEDLRRQSKNEDYEVIWRKHISDVNVRKSYSSAMHELATNFWEKNNNITRINWVVNFCIEYYKDGKLLEIISKETNRLMKKGISLRSHECKAQPFQKFTLLDVGSCYNPFSKYQDLFNVTAIDLSPATEEVKQCDFLELEIEESNNVKTDNKNLIKSLAQNSYDVVVFSMLLEYFPSTKQRHICCKKASLLLKPNGLLFIITPDSKHQNHNVRMMKSWKSLMLHLNLVRIKYEKLPHLHCMAFRKMLPDVIKHLYDGSEIPEEKLHELIFIPQDSNVYVEKEASVPRSSEDDNVIKENMLDLPFQSDFM